MRGCRCTGLVLCEQCHALAQRAGVLTPPEAPAVTEKQLMGAVIRLAKARGWHVFHPHDSRKSPGPGYPDLTLARLPRNGCPGQVIWAELKVDAPLTIEQEVWLATLSHVTQTRAYLWKPEDIERIREVLQ
jgi:hypothetical protein